MRLPLLIAVVVIVALLLPGPALMAAPEAPRMTAVTSYNPSPSAVMAYGAKGDAKTGMVTFVGRVYNNYTKVNFQLNKIRAKIPWNAQLVETWGGLPGTAPADGPNSEGWIQWNMAKGMNNAESNSAMFGFTVAGWDGKSTLTVGWECAWAGIPNTGSDPKKTNSVGGFTDETNMRDNVKAVTVNYPLDRQNVPGFGISDGIYRVVGVDGNNYGSANINVPSAEAFLALKKDVDALKSKAGISAAQDEAPLPTE